MSYIPPHRRAQAANGSVPDTAPAASSSPQPNGGGFRESGRESQVFRGNGGQRGGFGGQFRGGRNGYSNRGARQPSYDEADTINADDITRHFWDGQTGSTLRSTTLHDSQARPGELAYVCLFFGANPRWASDGIIFVKSELRLLPEYGEQILQHGPWDSPAEFRKARNGVDSSQEDLAQEYEVLDETTEPQDIPAPKSPVPDADTSESRANPLSPPPSPSDTKVVPASKVYSDLPTYPNIAPIDYNPHPHEPVAVFREVEKPFTYVFEGWYAISRINVIAARSAELVRLQQQKWEKRDRWGNVVPNTRQRDASAWQASMRYNWAVIKFEKVAAEEAPPTPSIEKTKVAPKKSVTEVLKEMRLGNTQTEPTVSKQDDSKRDDEDLIQL
ncbi:hypothetical protein BJ166DRAFT_492490 [Pestalotiopsis sp. NC0098]|nr:hypothetical protein BJ166DRAFT_492490 [Pestalotiopsis sp. NC0098]